MSDKADIKVLNPVFSFELVKEADSLLGMRFDLTYKGDQESAVIPEAVGYQAIYAGLAAATTSLALGMDIEKIATALSSVKLPAGRMKLISGNKGTMIIDDTYNSSPVAVRAALDFVKRIPVQTGSRKIAMLGDMLELGQYSEASHKEIGREVCKSDIDILVVVGEKARDIARGAVGAGMSRDNIFEFSKSFEAGRFIEQRMKEGDLILVKGSQGVRMEKIVLEIMAEPMRAKELLVRQDKQWID